MPSENVPPPSSLPLVATQAVLLCKPIMLLDGGSVIFVPLPTPVMFSHHILEKLDDTNF